MTENIAKWYTGQTEFYQTSKVATLKTEGSRQPADILCAWQSRAQPDLKWNNRSEDTLPKTQKRESSIWKYTRPHLLLGKCNLEPQDATYLLERWRNENSSVHWLSSPDACEHPQVWGQRQLLDTRPGPPAAAGTRALQQPALTAGALLRGAGVWSSGLTGCAANPPLRQPTWKLTLLNAGKTWGVAHAANKQKTAHCSELAS